MGKLSEMKSIKGQKKNTKDKNIIQYFLKKF